MSVGEAYTLGVRLTGDLSDLRQELAQGRQMVQQWSTASTDAMNTAAAAINRASAAMEAAASKSGQTSRRSQQEQQSQTRKTATAYEDYMRRVTAAEKQVAATSKDAAAQTTSALGSVGSTLGRLTGYAGFGLLAKQVWDTGIGFHEFTQNTQVALTTLLGTDAAAKDFLATILDFAKTTPYAFTDLTTQAQKLITYGFQTEQIVPILTAVGDAATGMGKGVEGIDNIVRSLGQINTKGRLQSEELLQLSENGVNGLKILANQAGMTTIEYQKLITKGLIPAETAIAGIVTGMEEGTNGVNGQTAAFGGLMEKIKGSGGITATLDSAKTGFRNAAAAVTDSLVPAYTGFLSLATRGLGVVKDTANVFNGLSQPVQNSALAFVAATTAVKLLNVEGRASAVWGAFTTHMQASKASAQAMGYQVGTMRTAMIAARAGASGLGSALLGAFGGPVGLAVMGVVTAITAFTSAQAAAKAATSEFANTLDIQTASLTDNSAAWVENNLTMSQTFGLGSSSMVEMAKKMGISVQDLTDAYLGQGDAYERVKQQALDWGNSLSVADRVTTNDAGRVKDFLKYLNDQQDRLKDATEIARAKTQVDKAAGAALSGVTQGYQDATNSVREYTEEQIKSITAAEDAARKAYLSGLSITGRDLNVSTADDVTKAQEGVADATDRVRDAESNLRQVRASKSSDADDIARAERKVADARKEAQKAADELTDVEARRDPVAQYRKQLEQMETDARNFQANIRTLAESGLNGETLLGLINDGPNANQDQIAALLADSTLIAQTNAFTDLSNRLSGELARDAGIATAFAQAGGTLGSQLGLAFQTAALEGTETTVQGLADKIGADPQRLYDAGMKAGLTWLSGLDDAMKFQRTVRVNADGSFQVIGAGGERGMKGYADGGVYPGYTPGRDIGYVGVSGGEAIMRPEWTRAVGEGWVHRMNAIARTSGIGGVRAEMARYLGGFASGGVAPSVVTVPVQVTNEHNTPWTIQNAYFTDRNEAQRWGRTRRASANTSGRR